MAKRYSGTLVLSVRYIDATSSYTVRITEHNDDARFETLKGLRLAPIHSNLAVDSAKAYDLAAEAALDFASYADEAIHNYACPATSYCGKFHVSRKADASFSEAWV
jgi:hypothetical protein